MKANEVAAVLLSRCRKGGASDVVVLVSENEEAMVRFSNNEISICNDIKETNAFIFVICQRRRAGTSIADMSKRSLEATADRLIDAANRSPPSEHYEPLPSGPFAYDRALLRSKEVSLDPKATIGWVKEAVQAALRAGASRASGSLTARNTTITIRTTGEADGVAKRSGIELSLRAFGEGLASGHAVCVATREQDFDPRLTGTEAGNMAKLAVNPVQGEAGSCPTVLGPMVFADLVQQVGRMASAFHVDAGMSFLAGRLNQPIGSNTLTLVDDAKLPGALGTMPFDHEGLPTKRTAIIEKGVLKSYLHNSSTAAKAGVESTANAGLIAPQPFNLVVEPGRFGLEDLIGQVDDGIFVTNDWYLRYQDYARGDFSTILRDALFAIEDGQIAGSIKGLRISDNLPRILSNLRAIGRERRWVKWWEVETPTLVPAVLVDDVRFTRSSM
jgi:PmbA protein